MDNDDLEDDIKELYELTVKVSRRVMYDLKHCIDQLEYCGDYSSYSLYLERYKHFETILEAASGTKDYRHRLHHTISGLEWKVDKLLKLLEENNIPVPEDPPI